MAQGDVINYSNFTTMYPGTSWRKTNTWTDTTSFTICVASPCFVAVARSTSVALRSNWVNLDIYYWNGSSWSTPYSPRNNNGYTVYCRGASGSSTFKFYHNRANEGTSSYDSHLHHLWKIVITMRGKDGSAHGYFDICVGGIELMNNTEYNNYFQGHPIKYCSCNWFKIASGETYTSDTAFINGEKPSVHKGTPISIAGGTANKLCYTPID